MYTSFLIFVLLNNLFKYPYTKIEFVIEDCQIHRNTAVKRLEELVDLGVLEKNKIGKENYKIFEQIINPKLQSEVMMEMPYQVKF